MTTSQKKSTCADPLAELLVPLAQGQLGAEDSGRVLEHVERCPACSRELDFLADLVTVASEDAPGVRGATTPAPPAVPAPGRLLRFPLGLIGGLAAAAAILFVVVPMFRAEPVSVAGLADWQRPAFDDVRSGNTGAFMTAMTFYAEGRDAEAEEELGRHLASATEPDPLARFYRAAVRVELGRLEDARDDLLVAAEHATGNLRDATLWNLANVHLMLEDADAALAALDDLAARDGRFRALAAELAGEVRATAR